jgi:hypothetical protein
VYRRPQAGCSGGLRPPSSLKPRTGLFNQEKRWINQEKGSFNQEKMELIPDREVVDPRKRGVDLRTGLVDPGKKVDQPPSAGR